MGDHYVPQYYLAGFCEPETPSTITRFEKGSSKIISTSPKNIAQETGFYSPEIERQLAVEVEGPANKVLARVKSGAMISGEEKAILARYVFVMLNRVPQGKERLQKQAPQVAASVQSQVDERLDQLIREDPSKAELIKKRKEEAKQLIDQYHTSLPKEIWLNLIPPNRASRVLEAINAMTWRFLVFDNAAAFLTSDNPVFFFESIGIGKQYSEISFPISKNIALWATWRTDFPEGFASASKRVVHEFNRRTVTAASRYVFFSRKEEWVSNLLKKKQLKLNYLR